jgi:hypothetical protein
MVLNAKFAQAMIRACARALVYVVSGFGCCVAGTFMLILVILAVGAASAMFHAQIVLA